MAPTGRPPKLNHVLSITDDGTAVTVRSRILDWLRIGMPRDTTVSRAGVSMGTFHHWLREAARLEEALHLNPDLLLDLTDHERDLLDFSREVDEATAEGEARYFAQLSQLARGGLQVVKTVQRYDAQGRLTESQTTTETTLPSERALMWILEKRYPAHYPRGPQQIELAITGRTNDPLSDQERAKLILHALDATTSDDNG